MAEAEDVITDVARHAVSRLQDWWRRRHPAPPSGPALADLTPRLSLLLDAVFNQHFLLRTAQPPAPPTLLGRWQARRQGPRAREALPATDSRVLWLPGSAGLRSPNGALRRFQLLALMQGMRAQRGGSRWLPALATPLEQDLFLLLEAQAADHALAQALPGVAGQLHALRGEALAARPPLTDFPCARRPLEALARAVLAAPPEHPVLPLTATVAESLAHARELASDRPDLRAAAPLFRDLWTGELLPAPAERSAPAAGGDGPEGDAQGPPPRSARLARRPRERKPVQDEDDRKSGAWMVQTAQPHEKAEDPVGLQRPTDRDEETAAEEYAESLAELPEARLVSTPGRPREVLLSDEPPEARAQHMGLPLDTGAGRHYPEWDWRAGSYRLPGARVLRAPAIEGDQAWVDATLARHQARLAPLRRQFALLQAVRERRRRQRDGEDIDLDAWIEAQADYRAGRPLAQDVYQSWRARRRDLAVLLLVDSSGSTDAWVAADRRVIDVAREALLLVTIALEQLREPAAILSFSGEGPQGVLLRHLKDFGDPWGGAVGRRIAALEPEHYTRTGAALRHAAATLMAQPARHRLLLLLSDGKPNDIDAYEGRYGVEDMRQAVNELLRQGISPFCLTIDRQAPTYLPAVFGAHRYALLQEPARLPLVLLDWLRRLLAA